MMNVTNASTNSTPVEMVSEETNSAQLTEVGPKGLSILKARGQTVSQQDVSQFQQALTRIQSDSEEHPLGPEAFKDAMALTCEELNPAAPRTVLPFQISGDEAVNAGNADATLETMNSQISARMRWIERRKFFETDKEEINDMPTLDGAAVALLSPENKLVRPLSDGKAETNQTAMAGAQNMTAPANQVEFSPLSQTEFSSVTQVESAPVDQENPMVNTWRTQITLMESHDHDAVLREVDSSASPVLSALPLSGNGGTISQASEVVTTTVDTAWASRTVQDTVRTTMRTLAQRDLESLDAGRPVQITLDQGQLRGAQLTLQAQDGLLEVSVSTSQAQLRATLDAQQDALAQGLLRDVGAVRWVGLQDALPNVSSSNDTNTSFSSSQQNSQGNGSDRQNQREAPASEPDDMGTPEKQTDRNQVIADAQSLRAFLGL